MSKIQAPKGTLDILPADSFKWQAVERIAREVSRLYDFDEIRTPIFEHTELFHRGVGETTDIVSKETYTFEDRGKRSLTLRPEGTAGVVRALIESSLLADQGARAKVFYIGPNFRYERPQKGRYTQHHQFGVEAFGVAEPEQDVECILLQMDFYRRCGVKDLALRINTLGDRESKYQFGQAIKRHLEPNLSSLSDESKQRWATNPLRILDSKDPRDIEACIGAPPVLNYLSEQSRKHFDSIVGLLTAMSLRFEVDPKLVRGFDYYTGVVWEVTAGGLGSQNAVGGGGRYDNLVELLGGRPTPAVGFGAGIERLLIALDAQGIELPRPPGNLVWLISHGDAARDANFKLLADLRAAGIAADMDVSGRAVKSQFKLADREKAAWTIVVGDTELAAGTVVLKNMGTGEQTTLPRDQVISRLK